VTTDCRSAWLLSAYRADSHAAWADWLLRTQQRFVWRPLELPGRHFAWRIRGNPLSWLHSLPDELPDLIVATSMVDLATLKGLHPRLAQVPALYYFHENQFSYPWSEHQHRSVDPQMVQLYGALAATRVVFNSVFNRDSFLAGVDDLLAKLPDAVPGGVPACLREKSLVCPVAIDPITRLSTERGAPPLILWNHRWEHDKQPEHFTEAMLRLAAGGRDFRLALLGKRPRAVPAAVARLRSALGERIVADGLLPRDAYREQLASAAIVISTAAHEFQGLSVLEAAAAGARPLVPDALCYPEQYPADYRYPAGDIDALVARLQSWLDTGLPPAVDVSAWYGQALQPTWTSLLETLA
jgi:glycosyltransferase involved in cell wall biosynthesis